MASCFSQPVAESTGPGCDPGQCGTPVQEISPWCFSHFTVFSGIADDTSIAEGPEVQASLFTGSHDGMV
eukprot:3070952-Karenia_brevis.AAC.1